MVWCPVRALMTELQGGIFRVPRHTRSGGSSNRRSRNVVFCLLFVFFRYTTVIYTCREDRHTVVKQLIFYVTHIIQYYVVVVKKHINNYFLFNQDSHPFQSKN